MNINHLVLMMGLLLTSVGGFFSIVGLANIFSVAFWSVVIMAGALETSKVVAASWLYRSWDITPWLIRIYMTLAVVILVAITSLGIFGYLSKAHLEQTINVQGNTSIQIEALERQTRVAQRQADSAIAAIEMLDATVETLQEYDRIRGPEGAIAVMESQKEERDSLNQTITTAYAKIDALQTEITPLRIEQVSQEAEIGPLKYIAEAIYGQDRARDYFDVAVRWIIIVLVSVFDPLAIVMILAGNVGLKKRKKFLPLTEEEILKDVDMTSGDGYNLT